LNTNSSSVELLFQLVQGAKVAVDRVSKRTWLENTSNTGAVLSTVCSRSKILPEDRMIDMTWFMASEYKKSIEMGLTTDRHR